MVSVLEISRTKFVFNVNALVLFVIVIDAIFDATIDDGIKVIWCVVV